MKKILQEFKQFAMRGNVIDMAVGIIIGGAFGKIVSSVVGDIIMPAIGLLIGGVNFTDLKIVLKQAVMDGDKVVSPAVSINYGNFLQVTFDFIIIAFSIFMLVKGINALNKKKEEAPAAPAPPPADIQLLTEIRDLLKDKKIRRYQNTFVSRSFRHGLNSVPKSCRLVSRILFRHLLPPTYINQ